MKIIRKKINTKKTITICILTIIISAALFTFLYIKTNFFGNNFNNNTVNTSPIDYTSPTEEQVKNGAEIKANGGSDKPTDPVVINGETKKQVDLTIINFSSTVLNVQINTVTSTGSCTLILTSPTHEKITQTSDIKPLASISACNTFRYAELSSGIWTIDVIYNSDTLTGNISDTRTIQ